MSYGFRFLVDHTLFGATDRDHEVQFRVMFSPLAQVNMEKRSPIIISKMRVLLDFMLFGFTVKRKADVTTFSL